MNWMTPSIASNIAMSTQMQFDYGRFLRMSIVSMLIKFVRLPHFMERLAIKPVWVCFLFCWWKTYVPFFETQCKNPHKSIACHIIMTTYTSVSNCDCDIENNRKKAKKGRRLSRVTTFATHFAENFQSFPQLSPKCKRVIS